MKTCRMILLALLMMVLVGGFATAEQTALYIAEGEKTVILDREDCCIYLTGDRKATDNCNGISGNFMFRLDCVVENKGSQTIDGVRFKGVINGWSLGSYHVLKGTNDMMPGTKVKSYIWFATEDVEAKSFEELETMNLIFFVEDENHDTLFEAETGPIYFNTPATESEKESVVQGEIAFGDTPDQVGKKSGLVLNGQDQLDEKGYLVAKSDEKDGIKDITHRYYFDDSNGLYSIVYKASEINVLDAETTTSVYDDIFAQYTELCAHISEKYGNPLDGTSNIHGKAIEWELNDYEYTLKDSESFKDYCTQNEKSFDTTEWIIPVPNDDCFVKIEAVCWRNLFYMPTNGGLGMDSAYLSWGYTLISDPLAVEKMVVTEKEPKYETLQKGSKGEDVKTMQNALKALGYLSGTVDGDFGPGTEKAVKAFQSAENLEANGIADSYTLEKLYSIELPEPQDLDVKITKLVNNSIGTPEIYVRFTNLSDKPIDRIDFLVYSYDAYGNLIKPYGRYDCTSFFYEDPVLNPGKTTASDWYWTLYDCDGTKKVRLVIEKYHFKDGKTVTVPYSDYVWYTFEK